MRACPLIDARSGQFRCPAGAASSAPCSDYGPRRTCWAMSPVAGYAISAQIRPRQIRRNAPSLAHTRQGEASPAAGETWRPIYCGASSRNLRRHGPKRTRQAAQGAEHLTVGALRRTDRRDTRHASRLGMLRRRQISHHLFFGRCAHPGLRLTGHRRHRLRWPAVQTAACGVRVTSGAAR